MLFWILTGALALVLTTLLAMALLRGRRETGPAGAFDVQIYRDQLAEIGRDAQRGKIPPEEAERLRTEISRRILTADARRQETDGTPSQPQRAGYAVAALIGLGLLGGGFGLYSSMGAPGYPDVPLKGRIAAAAELRATRIGQAAAEAGVPPQPPTENAEDYAALVVKLRAAMSERPDDLQGYRLLARAEAALGNYPQAYKAQQQIIRLLGKDVSSADYANLADMMVLAAGGYVSPEAEKALDQALSLDPRNGVARFYGGLMMAQTGRPDVGFRLWDQLLRDTAADAPWQAPIRAQIEEMAFRAGVTNYTPPVAAGSTAPARGPSQADIDSAADMTDADRQDMIAGMVDRLAERLADEGGPPEDWARLIFALSRLPDMDRAAAIWAEAQTVFAQTPQALATIREAAKQAGLEE